MNFLAVFAMAAGSVAAQTATTTEAATATTATTIAAAAVTTATTTAAATATTATTTAASTATTTPTDPCRKNCHICGTKKCNCEDGKYFYCGDATTAPPTTAPICETRCLAICKTKECDCNVETHSYVCHSIENAATTTAAATTANACEQICEIGNGPETCEKILTAKDFNSDCETLQKSGCNCNGWVCM